jgi:CubicO group peptidase (beta-lactamase class C family)
MTGRTLFACFLGMTLLLPLTAQDSIHKLDGSRITQQQAASFAEKTLLENHVTGAQIAVLNNGKLVWSYAYGLRHKDLDLPMDRETTTWAASITKSVFATYVMQLVERGEFDLDKPVAQQLPKPLDQYPAYSKSAADIVKDPRWQTVTPRMLLSHSSGLFNFAFMEPDGKMRFRFDPGTQFLYSGEGMNLVQFCIEQQKGKTLDVLMQDAIFGPLGMTRTSEIYQQRFADDVADRFDANGKFLSQTRRFPPRASGNMTSSAEDLSRFAEALFAGRIVNRKTEQQMLAPHLPIRSLHQFALKPNEPDRGRGEAGWACLRHGVGCADPHAIRTCLLQRGPWRRRAELHDLLFPSSRLHDRADQQRQR